MHVLPLSALDERPNQAFEANFAQLEGCSHPCWLMMVNFQSNIRFDGLVNEADGQGQGGKRPARTPTSFKSGAVEAVASSLAKIINSFAYLSSRQ